MFNRQPWYISSLLRVAFFLSPQIVLLCCCSHYHLSLQTQALFPLSQKLKNLGEKDIASKNSTCKVYTAPVLRAHLSKARTNVNGSDRKTLLFPATAPFSYKDK